MGISYLDMDQQFERLILGCLLQRPNLMNELIVESKHFFSNKNRNMFDFFKESFSKHKTIDPQVLSIESAPAQQMEVLEFCMVLLEEIVTVHHFQTYQEKQLELFNQRMFIDAANKLSRGEITYEDALQEVNRIEITLSSAKDDARPSEQSIYEMITSSDDLLEFKMHRFMAQIGLGKNAVHVIAARTSVGKSAFALNLMDDLGMTYNCIYFNMEMSEKKVYQRLVGMNGNTAIAKFSKLSKDEDAYVRRAVREVHQKRIKVINGSKSINAIRNMIIKNSKKGHLVAIVDYIGLLTNGKNQTDKDRIGEAVRELQTMTKDYDVTVFIVAQINRSGTDAPSLVHLKDSGELEQTGESCLILHDPVQDPTNQNPTIELLVLKNRNGMLGRIDLSYKKNTQKFSEIVYTGGKNA